MGFVGLGGGVSVKGAEELDGWVVFGVGVL